MTRTEALEAVAEAARKIQDKAELSESSPHAAVLPKRLWQKLVSALAALDAAPDDWRPIAEAPKDQVIDVWLGDASEDDVEFYCTPGTRRSPGWRWLNGKLRPVAGGLQLPTFVEPTHFRPLPPPPPEEPK